MVKIMLEEGQKLTSLRHAIAVASLEAENANLKADLANERMQLYISSLYIKYRMTEQDKISPDGEILYEAKMVAKPPIIKHGTPVVHVDSKPETPNGDMLAHIDSYEPMEETK